MRENDDVLLRTPLFGVHQRLGARLGPFVGWEMPIQYPGGIIAEHLHTRAAASLFDICHMGEFRVCGAGAAAALDFALARPVAEQKIGVCRYNFLLNGNGGVLDDLIVYRLDDEEFYIVVNAGNRLGDFAEIAARLPEGVAIVDESEATAKLDLQGPASAAALRGLGIDSTALPAYFHWTQLEMAGVECLVSRTGYTGELGFEIYCPVEAAVAIWEALTSLDGVEPAGLGARDTLRLEMGYPLYGHELNERSTPVEAGFGGMLKLDSGRGFIGAALKNTQPLRKLIGVQLAGRRAARHGDAVVLGGEKIGEVTSGAFAPSLERAVAMAMVNASAGLDVGDAVEILGERSKLEGRVAKLPFYGGGTARS